VSLKALSDYVCVSKYAHFNKKQGRRETWEESTRRMCDMHRAKYADAGEEVLATINAVERAIINKEILPSMRSMQFGSVDLLGRGQDQKIYNCSFSYVDRVEFFGQCMMNLLCGSGTGFSVQRHHVAKLPDIHKPRKETATFTIPDTIEGWADAVQMCVAQYFEADHPRVVFDFSQIRPKGSPISSGVGRAPGPNGLQTALMRIGGVFISCLSRGQTRLRPIDAYDVVMHASDAVLSGGVRRSASICLFSPDDEEMLNAKTGNWFNENPQRGRSNNSAVLLRGRDEEKFWGLTDAVKQFGEPGFLWVDDVEHGTNPCFSADTLIATDKGLKRMGDIVGQEGFKYISDNRIDHKGEISENSFSSTVHSGTPVALTQKQAQTYKLTTKHGHEIVCTDTHEFPTSRGRLMLKDMKPGDKILLQSGSGGFGQTGTYEDGLLLGIWVGDGTSDKKGGGCAYIDVWEEDQTTLHMDAIKSAVLSRAKTVPTVRSYPMGWVQTSNQKRIGGVRLKQWLETEFEADLASMKKRVPSSVLSGSQELIKGYIAGLIFADGSVQSSGHGKSKTVSVRITQSNKELLLDVQALLSSLGIVSSIYLRREEGFRKMPYGKGGQKDYLCKATYELIVSRPNALLMEGWLFGRKADALKSALDDRGRDCRKPERFQTEVKSIEIDKIQDVFCLTQHDNHTVSVGGGVIAGQCVEIGLRAYDDDGESGWQFCNLSTINMAKVKTPEEFFEACHLASAIGTLQAGYTEFAYLGPVSERITAREALIGVSMTGIAESPIAEKENLLRLGASVVRDTNRILAEQIGINPAARTTCVKPEGTASAVLQTSSGIHPHHHRRVIRRVQANASEPVIAHFAQGNPDAVTDSVWGAGDLVAEFPYEVAPGSLVKEDADALTLLERVVSVKRNWVDAGKDESLCVDPRLSHNVSNTINVGPSEWGDVFGFIHDNRRDLSGVSLLSASGDLDYPQAPFVAVWTEDEIRAEYGERMTEFALSCVDTIEVSHPPANLLHECVHRLRLLRRYEELRENWQSVDYREMEEDDDSGIKLSGTVACAGGSCEVL
jgi:intein/homing endonuclease